MKRAALRFSLVAVTAVMVLLALTGLSLAKSLYVIADIDIDPTPIRAYNVNADGTLTFQAEYGIPRLGGGAVGLAVDTATDTLFVTYEVSNTINLIDAKTMTSIGSTTAPGAYDLAGIVVDDAKQLIYTVDRNAGVSGGYLYVYKWDRATKTLTLDKQVTLADVGGNGAFGIALDKVRGLLYVGNYNSGITGYGIMAIDTAYTIPYYSTSDWDQAGTLTLAGPAIGIAVDGSRELVYSGAGWAGYSLLDWCNLQSYTTGGVDLGYGSGAMGIGVDEETGLVYVTTGYAGDELRVYQAVSTGTSDITLTLVQNVGFIGGAPTGLAIGAGFNPLNLEKSANTSEVNPGQLLTYTLSFDNLNNPSAVRNVILSDKLPPETVFVSATGGGVYDSPTHTVTWDIGNLVAGAVSQNRQLVVRVLAGTPGNTRIRNTATIDSDDTPPTTKSLETLVKVNPVFSLAFPVEGYTPYNAPCIAVLDHSVFETKPVQFYVIDDKVQAFNGELGEKVFGSKKLEGLWQGYKNSSGSNFLVDVLNYVEGPYLYYDGHPGYDYEVPKGSRILATASGKLYIAEEDPVNGGGWKAYKTFYIRHSVATGAGVLDYYTWYLYVKPTNRIMNEINERGYAKVRKGQYIGKTYNYWVHVDFRRRGIGHARIFDPYKLGLWESASD